MEQFASAWENARNEVFGYSRPLQWLQVALRGTHSGRVGYSLWIREDEISAIVNGPTERRFGEVWHLDQFPLHGKGVNATADALWAVRGNEPQEGLVLCYALIRELAGGSKARYISPLYSTIWNNDLPKWNGSPWHAATTRCYPTSVAGVYDELTSSLERLPHEKHGRAWMGQIAQVAAIEYAISTLRYRLVHVDILRADDDECRHNPVYENAEQAGDPR
jgi:hypothetical protein